FDRLVTRAGVLPRERLEVLVDLRVGELAPLSPLDRAPGRDEVEVSEPPGLLEPVPDVVEGRRTVELLAAGPGPAGDGDLVEPERDEGGRRGDHGRHGDAGGEGGDVAAR